METAMKKVRKLVTWVLGVGLLVLLFTSVTIFVVQPIGAIPEGKTLVILRMGEMNFIDSADAYCQRVQGKVNLLCRMMVLGSIGKNGMILLRLPYSETLYLYSTGGRTYSGPPVDPLVE
jgi:hypothetical protein